jgi:tetratricopeptide (TPR) repeat protein
MKIFRSIFLHLLALGIAAAAAAQPFAPNQPAPELRAQDIFDTLVDLKVINERQPDLVVLFFFNIETGEEIALKLAYLDQKFGRENLTVVAIGWEEDKEDLIRFAKELDIGYHIIDSREVATASWRDSVKPPMTVFLRPGATPAIERVLYGGGETRANYILKEVAENWYQQGKPEALAVAETAIAQGEDPQATRELKGYILTAQGKLDEAAAEFGAIDSKAGLAVVQLEQGNYEEAAKLAGEGRDAYARSVAAEAQMRAGNLDAAKAALADSTEGGELRPWQHAAAMTTQGRMAQESGDTDAAVQKYRQAVSLDPYNIVALSNEGAVQRDAGRLDEARAALERAAEVRPDDALTQTMLQQVLREIKEANDTRRGELIRAQINDLKARYETLKAEGIAEPADTWSTRPLVLALLPGANTQGVYFPRAGTETVLQRELETRLDADDRVTVVERAMLDKLLQELNLGSSELASADTQQRLGRVLSAGMLGFLDFGAAGGETRLFLRLVNTETTEIVFQSSWPLDLKAPVDVLDGAVRDIVNAIAAGRELKGLVADAEDPEAVVINLGKKHGVSAGQTFLLLVDGDPIEAGKRIIAYRQKTVGKLRVTAVEEDYSVAKVEALRDGVTLVKEMKIKLTE